MVDGASYAGTNAFIESESRLDFTEAYGLSERFSAGRLTSCLVNPDSASVAALGHLPLSHAGQSFFGLYFVLLGIAAFYAAKDSASTFSRNQLPILYAALAGLMFGIAMTSAGLFEAARVRGWIEVEATVDHSGERLVRGSGGGRSGGSSSSLHPDVLYRYTHEGQTIFANKAFVSGGGPAFESGRVKFLAEYPVGQRTTCWINPSNPAKSVLDRSPGWGWVIALPLVALASALAIAIRKVRATSKP